MTTATRKEIDEAFEAADRIYARLNRHSRQWAEDEFAYARAMSAIQQKVGHGNWMPELEHRGIPYHTVARRLCLLKWGATVEMLMEHGLTGTLALLSQQRRAAKMEVEGDPEPEPDPSPAEDGKFCSSAKFEGTEAEPDPASSGTAEAPAHPAIQAWKAVRERLREAVGEPSFKAWLADLGMEARDGAAVLLARTAFNRDRVRQEFGERISRFLEEELPGVRLEYGVAEAAPGPAPELPLPEGAAADPEARLYMVPEPEKFDPKMAGDRMASCMMLHDLKNPGARAFLAMIVYRDGPKLDGWIASVRELQAIFGVSKRRIQRWSRACEEAGYLRVVPRRNRANRYHAFPSGLDYPHQYRMTLLRIMDLNREAAVREAAVSAAARPPRGDDLDTSGATPAAAKGDGHDTLNPRETDNETGAARRQPSQALAAGRRR